MRFVQLAPLAALLLSAGCSDSDSGGAPQQTGTTAAVPASAASTAFPLGIARSRVPATDAAPPRFLQDAEEEEQGLPFLAPVFPIACELELSPEAARPTRYVWDGRHPVPAPGGIGPLELPYGETGVGPATALYEPFHSGLEPGDERFRIEAEGAQPAQGVFGGGARLSSASSLLTITRATEEGGTPLLAGTDTGGSWTVEFWWRPTEAAARKRTTFVGAPGVFELQRRKDDRIEVRFADESELFLVSRKGVRTGAWNRIGLVCDGVLENIRLSVDGISAGKLWPEGFALPAADRLEFRTAGDVDEVHVDRRGLATSELALRTRRGATAGEHRLVLHTENGSEELRLWAGALTVPSLEGPEHWMRAELSHFDASGGELRWVPASWSRDEPLDPLLPRTTHPTIYVGDHQAFIFSGETRDSWAGGMQNTSDTWIYHIDEERWEEVPGQGPSGRCHQSSAYSPDHDVVFYAGGWANEARPSVVFKEAWLFHVKERRWERLDDLPHTMSDSAVVYNSQERRFYMIDHRRILTYAPDDGSWGRGRVANCVDAEGNPVTEYRIPGSPIAEYDPQRNQMLIFGGTIIQEGRTRAIADDHVDLTMIYDFEKQRLELVDPPLAPSHRTRGALAYDSRRDRFVLFGGVRDQGSQRMRDLWVFDMDSRTWREIHDANPPTRRGGFYKMAYDPELDVFSLLCGRGAPQVFHDEAWRLSFDETAQATARYVFDRAGFPERDRLVARWDAPEGSRVALRIESSRDALRWTSDAQLEPDARFLRVEVTASPPEGGAESVRVTALGFGAAAEIDGTESAVIELAPLGL